MRKRLTGYDMFCVQVVIGLPLEKPNCIILFLLLVLIGEISKRAKNEILSLYDRPKRKKQSQDSGRIRCEAGRS